jgi:F-type H+-transporting ATPase subunit b
VFVLAALPAQASDTLELMPDPLVTGILLVVFVLIIFPLNSLILKPLLKVMDEREEKIDGARNRADRVQGQAQEALDSYEEAIRIAHDGSLAERRRKLDVARSELHSITGSAKQQAERDLLRARDELMGSLGEARQSLRGSAEELAILVAERVLGRSLS